MIPPNKRESNLESKLPRLRHVSRSQSFYLEFSNHRFHFHMSKYFHAWASYKDCGSRFRTSAILYPAYGEELRVTSHMSKELWPWNCESPKESVQRAVPRHLQNHVVCSQTLKCIVKSYVTGPSTKCYSNEFLFVRLLTHDTINKSTVVNVWSARVFRFCVRPTPKRRFLKIVVTVKHDPFDVM